MLPVAYEKKEEELEESIYKLIPKTPENKSKSKRYKSVFNDSVKNEIKSIKKEKKTLGPVSVCLNTPENYLKKRSMLPQLIKDDKCNKNEEKKSPVSKHDENVVLLSKTNKDFISRNAVENILSIPKKPACKFTDTRNGTTHSLEKSGLVPMYLKKKSYGKLPGYLTDRNKELSLLQNEYDLFVQESINHGAMKCLSSTERDSIISGLKLNWEEIHHQYQGLSVVTDTAPKRNRKERMEAVMNQLEKDIELLESHSKIYVSNPTYLS
ncbi:enkurin isoform X2 [Hydra vulgaris]|uniref:Enkurin isoform X2 n=1 Tax=Hydra vulgaris TaxID=6087 RepID=A0ABM4CXQ8_HYDVU